MSTDLEEAIAETLRPRGDGPIDITSLRRAAVQQAGSIRRRRIVSLSAGVVVVAAVLAVVPFVRTGGPGGDTRVGGPGADGGPVQLMPPTADAPGAKARPDLVGTDPAVLHFDVDLTGTLATGTTWGVNEGVETVDLWTSDFDHFNHRYALANDPAKLAGRGRGMQAQPAETRQVSVGGRPATATFWPTEVSSNKKPDVPTWMVAWQPAAGLWATVALHTTDPADAVTAAEALRVDRSLRCVAPLRFDPAPAGYSLASCWLSFGHILPWSGSSVEIERADGVRYGVDIGPGGDDPDHPFVSNRTVRGLPAMVETGDRGAMSVVVPVDDDIMLTVRGPYRWGTVDGIPGRQEVAGTEADLMAVAETIIPGPNFTDPDTWPVRALG